MGTNMKKGAKRLIVGAMALALVAGCGNDAGTGGTPAGDTIKVGLNYELSGGVATYGQSSVDGIELAIKEVNDAGGVDGKKIELVKYDNKSEPAEATTLATKLMTQDKVVAVIGPATSGSFKATVQVANSSEVPIISGSATADDVTVDKDGKVQPYVFRTCFNDSFQGTAMAKYAAEKLSAKTAVIIKDNSSDYAKGLADNFKSTFEAGGGSIVAEEAYVSKDTEFNAILTSIKSKSFDVIYLPGYYEEAGLVIKQARELGIDAPIMGGDGFDSPTLAQLAGAEALNKVYFTNHYSSLDKDPKVTKFIEAYNAAKGEEPDAFNALGYDTANFLVDAIKRAATIDGPGIQKALAETKDFPAVTGTFSVDASHNPVKSIVVIELGNGEQVASEKV